MTEPPHQLDPDAQRYQEHWQPVLDGAAQRLLERVVATDPLRRESDNVPLVLDIGAGTGALTFAAWQRWPAARIIGLDASAAMLAVARSRDAQLSAGGEAALGPEWLLADAASVPLPDGSASVVVSSFVLQLVSDRDVVLREIHRLLRPGGVFGFVTWIAEELQMDADVAFDEAVYELELDDPESVFREVKPGDYEGLAEAESELLAAGFDHCDVRADQLSYSWTRDAYLEFKRTFDERELFESLDADASDRLAVRVAERWRVLPDRAFTLTAPLVSAVAYRR